jgi:hypothetical protein
MKGFWKKTYNLELSFIYLKLSIQIGGIYHNYDHDHLGDRYLDNLLTHSGLIHQVVPSAVLPYSLIQWFVILSEFFILLFCKHSEFNWFHI